MKAKKKGTKSKKPLIYKRIIYNTTNFLATFIGVILIFLKVYFSSKITNNKTSAVLKKIMQQNIKKNLFKTKPLYRRKFHAIASKTKITDYYIQLLYIHTKHLSSSVNLNFLITTTDKKIKLPQ